MRSRLLVGAVTQSLAVAARQLFEVDFAEEALGISVVTGDFNLDRPLGSAAVGRVVVDDPYSSFVGPFKLNSSEQRSTRLQSFVHQPLPP